MTRLLPLMLALCACSEDGEPVFADSGPAGTRSSAAGGAGGNEAEGGAAGHRDAEGGAGARPDLDTDGVPDCEATLVDNPTFDVDVDGWTEIGDSNLHWVPKDALDVESSGSARLASTGPTAAAMQCVALEGRRLVVAYASAFVSSSEDGAQQTQAVLEVSFFDSADCSGLKTGFFETPPSAVVDAWATIQAGALSSKTTRSISIALVGRGDPEAGLTAWLDNVMLKAAKP